MRTEKEFELKPCPFCGSKARLERSHRAFINACALLDLDVKWIYPKGGGMVSGEMSAADIEENVKKNKPAFVYLTSPDYLGHFCDIKRYPSERHQSTEKRSHWEFQV